MELFVCILAVFEKTVCSVSHPVYSDFLLQKFRKRDMEKPSSSCISVSECPVIEFDDFLL